MKIRVTNLDNEHDQGVMFECEGNHAVVGRAPTCDIVIPRRHVSSQHAIIVQGPAVIDLDSTNGVFVAGSRVEGVSELAEGVLRLGAEVELEVEWDEPEVPEQAPVIDFEATLISEEAASLDLSPPEPLQTAPARPSDPTPTPIPAVYPKDLARPSDDARRLRLENDDLQRRLESLKKEIEDREAADAESPQARLAHDAMQSVRDQNEALQARVLELEQEKGRADVEAAKRVLEGRVTELESLRADLTAEVERLQRELEEAKVDQATAEATPASDLFFKLQKELARVKKELAEATSSSSANAPDNSELFFELREENARLKKQLEASEATADAQETTGASPPPSRIAELESELHAERMSKADMLEELNRLRSKVESGASGEAPPVRSAGGSGETLALLGRAAREDVTGLPTDLRLETEEFLALELFRFVRHGEKIVTRMAGQMIQLYDPKTMLPGTERTLRTLTEEVVEAGEDPGLRIELTEYLDSLTKWLGAILHAFPQAAEEFAFKLRSDLSEASLTRDDPIPRLKRLSGQAEGELWERACKVLNRLSDETVRDGVESLARRHAESFVEEPSGE